MVRSSYAHRVTALAVATGLLGCKPQNDACASFPAPSRQFDLLSLYPSQFAAESPRKAKYMKASQNNSAIKIAMNAISDCYPKNPHLEFKDDIEFMILSDARVGRNHIYYIIYEFEHITDARVIFEVDPQGKVLRSMTGGMV